MGDRRGRRAVGGCGEIDAAGKEASNGASSSSARGGKIGGCIVVVLSLKVRFCWVVCWCITCKIVGTVWFDCRVSATKEKMVKEGRKEDMLRLHCGGGDW